MGRAGDALISVGVVAVLLVALSAMDERVRVRFGDLLRGAPGSEFSSVFDRLRETAAVVLGTAWDQSVANAPLTIFVVVATLLVVFMVRT